MNIQNILRNRHEMKAYSVFAGMYDSFMSHIPYGKWSKSIVAYLRKNGFEHCPVLELGCGTGSMTIRLAKAGYLMVGVDLSLDMLERANLRTERAGVSASVLYQQQDMRALAVPELFPVVISVCDSMNYLLDMDELKAVLDNVYCALRPGGIFLFDVKTETYYRNLGNQTFTDENEQGTYIWQNEYEPETKNNYYDMTFFVKRPLGFYQKYTEQHIQHAFSVTQVKNMARETGFTLKDHLGIGLCEEADITAERMYFVLQKP